MRCTRAGMRSQQCAATALVMFCHVWPAAAGLATDGGSRADDCPHAQLSGCYTQSTCADIAKQQSAVSYCYDPTVDPDWGVCILVNCTTWCPNASAPVGACRAAGAKNRNSTSTSTTGRGLSSTASPDRTSRRVLFVGNSYTFFNDLPDIYSNLSSRLAAPIDATVGMVAPGGRCVLACTACPLEVAHQLRELLLFRSRATHALNARA
jgi:hypothetical protein